jgi:hypothetical protein
MKRILNFTLKRTTNRGLDCLHTHTPSRSFFDSSGCDDLRRLHHGATRRELRLLLNVAALLRCRVLRAKQ